MKAKVTWDLVHMRHRDLTPTALRLSPLQFRVLKAVETGAKLDLTEYEWSALVMKNKDVHRVHATTAKSLLRRKLILKHEGKLVLSIIAVACLEVYEL